MNISVAVTTFNDETTIIPILQQFINQTYKPTEIVIADGGSKDRTIEVVETFAGPSEVPIRVIADGIKRNIPKGFNDAIKNTNCDWVLVVGTGNDYEKDFIEKFVAEQKEKQAKVYYCTIIGNETTAFAHCFNQYFLRGNKAQDLNISNHGMLIHKSVFKEHGYFWENFIYAGEDLEFPIRLHKKGVESVWVKNAIAHWDTPQTWKEYKKKMNVNSIADWQIFDKSVILKRCMLQILALFAYIALGVMIPWFYLLIIPALVLVGYKKKTANIGAVLLGLYTRYYMIYLYAKNRKYAAEAFHIPVQN